MSLPAEKFVGAEKFHAIAEQDRNAGAADVVTDGEVEVAVAIKVGGHDSDGYTFEPRLMVCGAWNVPSPLPRKIGKIVRAVVGGDQIELTVDFEISLCDADRAGSGG